MGNFNEIMHNEISPESFASFDIDARLRNHFHPSFVTAIKKLRCVKKDYSSLKLTSVAFYGRLNYEGLLRKAFLHDSGFFSLTESFDQKISAKFCIEKVIDGTLPFYLLSY